MAPFCAVPYCSFFTFLLSFSWACVRQIELGLDGPGRDPGDATVRGLLIRAAIPLPPPGGSTDAGGQDFRIIDAAYLQVDYSFCPAYFFYHFCGILIGVKAIFDFFFRGLINVTRGFVAVTDIPHVGRIISSSVCCRIPVPKPAHVLQN